MPQHHHHQIKRIGSKDKQNYLQEPFCKKKAKKKNAKKLRNKDKSTQSPLKKKWKEKSKRLPLDRQGNHPLLGHPTPPFASSPPGPRPPSSCCQAKCWNFIIYNKEAVRQRQTPQPEREGERQVYVLCLINIPRLACKVLSLFSFPCFPFFCHSPQPPPGRRNRHFSRSPSPSHPLSPSLSLFTASLKLFFWSWEGGDFWGKHFSPVWDFLPGIIYAFLWKASILN